MSALLTVKSSYSAAGRSVVCKYSSSWDTLSIKVLKSCMAAFAFAKLPCGNCVGKTVSGAWMVAKGFSAIPAPTIYTTRSVFDASSVNLPCPLAG